MVREPTRRALTHVDRNGERTITTIGPKLRPRGPLPLEGTDTVFFVAGDAEALRSARAARFLGATTRELPTLEAGAVHLDLLVGSGNDPGEVYEGGLDAAIVVKTDGARGGTANGRRYDAAPLPGPIADTYGAGDTFGCTLCFALGRGDDLDDALALAARESAEATLRAVRVRGPLPPSRVCTGSDAAEARARSAWWPRPGQQRCVRLGRGRAATPIRRPASSTSTKRCAAHRVVEQAVERHRHRRRALSPPPTSAATIAVVAAVARSSRRNRVAAITGAVACSGFSSR